MSQGQGPAERVRRVREPRDEKQPLDPVGIALEQGAHGGEPADPQPLSLVRRPNGSCTAFVASRRRHWLRIELGGVVRKQSARIGDGGLKSGGSAAGYHSFLASRFPVNSRIPCRR